jgi:diaminopimelate epimerase
MIAIRFAKLHGAENDFLLTWASEIEEAGLHEIALAETARRICERTTGVGADGWMLLWPEANGVRTRLFNSDGSEPELSGNGTRCAAAFALLRDVATPPEVTVSTAAGPKALRLIERKDHRFVFEMNMGTPRTEELRALLRLTDGDFDAALLNVGNPQCAIFVDKFPQRWRQAAAEAEGHSRFPNRSNVSFVRVLDRHTIETLFFERGAGETRSSGTGSTGAAAAAILRGLVASPVTVLTPAGALTVRWDESIFLTGPAQLIAEGRFYLEGRIA